MDRAVSFTGTAIETLPYDGSQSLLRWRFKSLDGTEREVHAIGPAPDTPDWWVEDSFTGPLPVIGRTYTIEGWSYGPSEPILLNACKPNTVVDVTDTVDTTRPPASQESPPDSLASTSTATPPSSRSSLEVAGIVSLGFLAALVGWSVWRLRRRQTTGHA